MVKDILVYGGSVLHHRFMRYITIFVVDAFRLPDDGQSK